MPPFQHESAVARDATKGERAARIAAAKKPQPKPAAQKTAAELRPPAPEREGYGAAILDFLSQAISR